MTQLLRWLAAAVVVAGVVALGMLGNVRAAQPEGPDGRTILRRPVARFPAVPGYYALQRKHVRDQLELTDEQADELEALGKTYYEKMRSQYAQQDWTKLREMSREERREHYARLNEKRRKMAEETKAEIEKILLPHQLKQLGEISFRARAAAMLYNPRMLDQARVSEQQKETLEKIRAEYQEKIQELRDESVEKMLDTLTPEQRKKLEQAASQAYQAWPRGQGGAARQ